MRLATWLNALGMGLAAAGLAGGADGDSLQRRTPPREARPEARRHAELRFNRIATLPNYLNNTDIAGATVSEIVASTRSGEKLVYTDSLLEEIGFVDIAQPEAPVGLGKVELDGSPTSVAVLGEHRALVAVDTSLTFALPSGYLAVVDIEDQVVLAEIALDGQPDSVAISPDGRYVVIAIENQRDEDVTVDGVEGGLPQAPSGLLDIVDLTRAHPSEWAVRRVSLEGLSAYAPADAEAEFVDINDRNEAAVTLQENDHVLIVDLPSGRVVSDFAAGSVTLDGIDATEDGVIALDESLADVPREPDAVAWVPGRHGGYIATANEGDLFGGSRGFSIFDREGNVVFDSGSSLEEIAVRHGHYPEARSDAKGSEPESVEYARFGDTDYLFVGSERGSFVAVYELGRGGTPRFVQLLPAPLGPEGVHAIPSRGLLVVSGEEDVPSFGVRSSVMIYELGAGKPSYPQIVSADDEKGKPIPWSALSGLVAVPGEPDRLLAVWDGYYAESRVLTLDVSRTPAIVTDSMLISGGSGGYDPEGIAIAPDGSLWMASEGNGGALRNRLVQLDASGVVSREVELPAQIEGCRAASTHRGTLASGFEGVAVASKGRRGYVLLVAQQRGWDYTTPECEALDDDPTGENPAEPRQTRIWVYDPAAGTWSHFAYELEPLPEHASWVGLSEITRTPGAYVVIERDNRTGDFAELKTLALISDSALAGGVSRSEKRSFDLLPALRETHGLVSDKPEGVALSDSGQLFVVTDNDGVEDWSGETWFLRLGRFQRLFR